VYPGTDPTRKGWLSDENFNKKPNSAKKRLEKVQALFVVLLFLCHKKTSKEIFVLEFITDVSLTLHGL